MVTHGNPLARSNLIWYPKTLLVPVPVLSVFEVPFAITCDIKSRYCFIFYKIAPTITAVNNDASVPAIKAKTPSFDKSPVLLGAKDPIPPI